MRGAPLSSRRHSGLCRHPHTHPGPLLTWRWAWSGRNPGPWDWAAGRVPAGERLYGWDPDGPRLWVQPGSGGRGGWGLGVPAHVGRLPVWGPRSSSCGRALGRPGPPARWPRCPACPSLPPPHSAPQPYTLFQNFPGDPVLASDNPLPGRRSTPGPPGRWGRPQSPIREPGGPSRPPGLPGPLRQLSEAICRQGPRGRQEPRDKPAMSAGYQQKQHLPPARQWRAI